MITCLSGWGLFLRDWVPAANRTSIQAGLKLAPLGGMSYSRWHEPEAQRNPMAWPIWWLPSRDAPSRRQRSETFLHTELGQCGLAWRALCQLTHSLHSACAGLCARPWGWNVEHTQRQTLPSRRLWSDGETDVNQANTSVSGEAVPRAWRGCTTRSGKQRDFPGQDPSKLRRKSGC